MKYNYYDRDIECMARGEIEALQNERLVRQVKYVYDNVAPYRKKMDAAKVKPADIKSVKDLCKLPFNDKADLRDNYPFGLLAVPRGDLARVHASSGTTGKLTVSGYTRNDLEIWGGLMARCLVNAGATPESVIHVAYGYGLFTGGLGVHIGAEKLGAAVVPASSGNTARQIMLIMDLKADLLCCTPSYAAYIADEMKRMGIEPADIPLKAGMFGAEPWTEGMRRSIERDLGIEAFDIYGLSEIMGPSVSIDCPAHNGLHVWEDHFIAEIVDPKTLEPIDGDGKTGELVFTTLTKEGMPLIRYRTKDLCSLGRAPCACGRTHARMGKIKGRSDDMLIIRGINVFPSQIETVLLNIREAAPHYQIVVDRVNNLDTLEIQVELNEGMFSDTVKGIEAVKKQIQKEMAAALGIAPVIRLAEPRSLPRSEGKAKRVVDKRALG
ncbi:MAG: phenylacetate--CoA ligase [Clostridiales bacterium]|jgi:phenylacetate-CoA ligase|nr:phenylacetate--CoA ligase [Clostridiales bacterium]